MEIKATVFVVSNLGFTDNIKAEVEIVEKETAKIRFSTGFIVDAIFLSTNDEVDIYTYRSKYSNDTHYLHVRRKGDKLYCQTVQNGTETGGSTFIIPLPPAKHDGININSWYLTSRGHYVYIGETYNTSKSGNTNIYKGELIVFKNTNEIVTAEASTAQMWFYANELKAKVNVHDTPKLLGIINKIKASLL